MVRTSAPEVSLNTLRPKSGATAMMCSNRSLCMASYAVHAVVDVKHHICRGTPFSVGAIRRTSIWLELEMPGLLSSHWHI